MRHHPGQLLALPSIRRARRDQRPRRLRLIAETRRATTRSAPRYPARRQHPQPSLLVETTLAPRGRLEAACNSCFAYRKRVQQTRGTRLSSSSTPGEPRIRRRPAWRRGSTTPRRAGRGIRICATAAPCLPRCPSARRRRRAAAKSRLTLIPICGGTGIRDPTSTPLRNIQVHAKIPEAVRMNRRAPRDHFPANSCSSVSGRSSTRGDSGGGPRGNGSAQLPQVHGCRRASALRKPRREAQRPAIGSPPPRR